MGRRNRWTDMASAGGRGVSVVIASRPVSFGSSAIIAEPPRPTIRVGSGLDRVKKASGPGLPPARGASPTTGNDRTYIFGGVGPVFGISFLVSTGTVAGTAVPGTTTVPGAGGMTVWPQPGAPV